jgi:hypothetical protein
LPNACVFFVSAASLTVNNLLICRLLRSPV